MTIHHDTTAERGRQRQQHRRCGVLFALSAAAALLLVAPSAARAATSSTAILGNTSSGYISSKGTSTCAAGSYVYGVRVWNDDRGAADSTFTEGLAALCRDAVGNLSQASPAGYTSSSEAFDSVCNGSDPAVGIYGRSGEILDALGIVCINQTTGLTYDAALVGGTGGTAAPDTLCPSGSALTGFTGWFGSWDTGWDQYAAQGNCDLYNAFSGVLQPVNADGTSIFKAGSTVPVKFMITDPVGASVSDLTATLSYAMIDNGIAGDTYESSTNVAATTGNQFRYDLTSQQYIFNWSTKGLASGTYALVIDLSDSAEYTVDISLK